jgi:hypothetical protein
VGATELQSYCDEVDTEYKTPPQRGKARLLLSFLTAGKQWAYQNVRAFEDLLLIRVIKYGRFY